MTASRAPVPPGEMILGDCTLVRELGSRLVPTYAARRNNDLGEPELVIVERLVRDASNLERTALVMHDAKRLSLLLHPNVARVREVEVISTDLLIVTEFVDGESYADVLAAAAKAGAHVPLVVHLRVLVDVLAGLAAIHLVRDAKGEPLQLFHGEVDPANILLGVEGTAKLTHPCRMRAAAPDDQAAASRMAPEILLAEKNVDHRADIYSCGVLLWEALTGKPLFGGESASKVLKRQLAGIPMAVAPSGEPWAKPLVEIAARAMSADPSKRHRSASDLAAEIRKIVGGKLPLKQTVAALVAERSLEKIRARRAELAPGLPVRPSQGLRESKSLRAATPMPPMAPASPPRLIFPTPLNATPVMPARSSSRIPASPDLMARLALESLAEPPTVPAFVPMAMTPSVIVDGAICEPQTMSDVAAGEIDVEVDVEPAPIPPDSGSFFRTTPAPMPNVEAPVEEPFMAARTGSRSDVITVPPQGQRRERAILLIAFTAALTLLFGSGVFYVMKRGASSQRGAAREEIPSNGAAATAQARAPQPVRESALPASNPWQPAQAAQPVAASASAATTGATGATGATATTPTTAAAASTVTTPTADPSRPSETPTVSAPREPAPAPKPPKPRPTYDPMGI